MPYVALLACVLVVAGVVTGAGRTLFTGRGFMPHGVCYSWDPGLMRLHLISDSLIGVGYFSIPAALVYFMRKREDLPFSWMFLLFGIFIIACGTTHWMEVWTLWHPHYWLAGWVKALTAGASVPTAIALAFLIPRALEVPSVKQLRDAKEALELEVFERKRAEEKLRQAQAELERRVAERTAELAAANGELERQHEWLQIVLSSIGDAVIATGARSEILFTNAIAQTLTGWSPAEAVGRPLPEVFNIVHAGTRLPANNPVLGILSGKTSEVVSDDTILVARDGREIPIDDNAAPIRDPSGAVVGVVLVFRDVTERKAAEQALREADKRKDDFLAILGHELRNPLSPIRHAVAVLRAQETGRAHVQRSRDVIERQVAQMTRLLDDLLDVSRITRNRLELRKESLELTTVIAAAVEISTPLIEAKGHRLTMDLPTQSVRLYADPTRLAQVFGNLLNNAAKYTNAGGEISVSAKVAEGQVVVSVKDNGIGLDPAHKPRLFEIFSQAGSALERSEGGLGIGLAVVHGLVELHGGTVEAESDGVNQGTEIRVTLPIETNAPAPIPKPHATSTVGRRLRILIADDNRDSADSMSLLLQLQGHEVRTAYDGAEALAAAESFHPDVAVLDIAMPGMNGYETATRIRREPWGGNVMLVAMSGFGQESDKRRAAAAGFDHHLTKPVDNAVLEQLLSRL